MTVNCLASNDLLQPRKYGNFPLHPVDALLDAQPLPSSAILGIWDVIEDMLEVGDINSASSILSQ